MLTTTRQSKKRARPHNYEGLTANCLECQKQFPACRSNLEKFGCDKFCSKICANRFNGRLRRRPNKLCEFCSVEFYPKSKYIRFCSQKCAIEKRKLDGGFSEPRAKMTAEQKLAQSKRIKAYYDNGGIPWNKGVKQPERSGPNHHFWGKKRPEVSGCNNVNWKGGVSANARFNNDYRIWRDRVFVRDNYTCQICGVTNVYVQADHIKRYSEFPELRYDIDNGRTLCVPCHYYVTFKKTMPHGISWGMNPSRRIAKF